MTTTETIRVMLNCFFETLGDSQAGRADAEYID